MAVPTLKESYSNSVVISKTSKSFFNEIISTLITKHLNKITINPYNISNDELITSLLTIRVLDTAITKEYVKKDYDKKKYSVPLFGNFDFDKEKNSLSNNFKKWINSCAKKNRITSPAGINQLDNHVIEKLAKDKHTKVLVANFSYLDILENKLKDLQDTYKRAYRGLRQFFEEQTGENFYVSPIINIVSRMGDLGQYEKRGHSTVIKVNFSYYIKPAQGEEPDQKMHEIHLVFVHELFHEIFHDRFKKYLTINAVPAIITTLIFLSNPLLLAIALTSVSMNYYSIINLKISEKIKKSDEGPTEFLTRLYNQWSGILDEKQYLKVTSKKYNKWADEYIAKYNKFTGKHPNLKQPLKEFLIAEFKTKFGEARLDQFINMLKKQGLKGF